MIELRNVNYTYNQGRPDSVNALTDVNLTVPDGSVCAIIGETGSGKSTLIQLLNGLEKPLSGDIFINGEEITAKSVDLRKLRFKVGMVFQYPEYQLFEETVKKDIAFGPLNMGLGEREIRERIERTAELVGLSKSDLDKSPFELSGGQKRRAAIAGVLAMEPEILVMDEPAAGLDPKGRRNIFGIIERLHRERPRMIIIFVSHSMEDAARVADRVVVMSEGRVVMDDVKEKIFAREEELVRLGLDAPEITKLCRRLRAAGMDIPEGIYTVAAAAENIREVLMK